MQIAGRGIISLGSRTPSLSHIYSETPCLTQAGTYREYVSAAAQEGLQERVWDRNGLTTTLLTRDSSGAGRADFRLRARCPLGVSPPFRYRGHNRVLDDTMTGKPSMVDAFGRRISYVRLSVTDRCDLRCRYCMAEKMTFLPRKDLLDFSEIEKISDALIRRGVRKIRLTGGEPLVRRGILDLVAALGSRVGDGLDELTLTTNATQLAPAARSLASSGVQRLNVSLDALDRTIYAQIARRDRLEDVLAGIAAAKREGLSVKINMVALKGVNQCQIEPMMAWCAVQGHDLTLIETMPLGKIDEVRQDRYLPLDAVVSDLTQKYTLVPSPVRTGGPARYFDVSELGLRLGLITPLTNNFCEACNRIRITATGTVFSCLGHDDKVELREILRRDGEQGVMEALDALLARKPKRHNFDIASSRPAVARHMSMTGG